MEKELLEKIWGFAYKVVQMAEEEKLSIREFYRAMDVAKGIAEENSVVCKNTET